MPRSAVSPLLTALRAGPGSASERAPGTAGGAGTTWAGPERRAPARSTERGRAVDPRRAARPLSAALLLALLAACGTVPHGGPGNVSRLPPGNAQRDGPEANPPPNLDAVPDAVPQIEPLRNGGPNKPYEIDGHTYVPLTDDRPVNEKGLASWYGKKFHGRRTASGEAYNMYAMTAAHKTLPIPSYARVRNPANGHEIIVRVNDRGPFSPNRVIDLSYTAALKLGVLGGVQTVEIERITADDIRTGAAFRHGPELASAAPGRAGGAIAGGGAAGNTPGSRADTAGNPAPAALARGRGDVRPGEATATAAAAPATTSVVRPVVNPVVNPATPGAILPPGVGDVVVPAADGTALAARATASSPDTAAPTTASTTVARAPGLEAMAGGRASAGVDLGAAAAADADRANDGGASAGLGSAIGTAPPAAERNAGPRGLPPGPVLPSMTGGGAAVAMSGASGVATTVYAAGAGTGTNAEAAPGRPELRDEHGRAETTAGAGFWVQLGAYKERNGALDFQHRLIDEQPWLAPLLAVFNDRGLNKLQAGPYVSRDDAKSVAEHIRVSLQLVPTIIEKR